MNMLTTEYLKAATIKDLRHGFESESFSCEDLVRAYLREIEANNLKGLKLRAIIDVCPEDVIIPLARGLDKERKEGKVRGPLHGIPIVVKDNIDTDPSLGMGTTAGSYALRETTVPCDAFLITKLRDAGAIILAKANLSEFSNCKRDQAADGKSYWNGWSAVGGQTMSPILNGRRSGGSSTGSAVALLAGFAPASIGTDTNGSVIDTARRAGLYALKPTVGLISRGGIVPISESQDCAGPMGKTVADVALLLESMVGEDVADEKNMLVKDMMKANYIQDCEKGCRNRGIQGVVVAIISDEYLARWWDYPEEEHLHEPSMKLFWQSIALLQMDGFVIRRANFPPLNEQEFEDHKEQYDAILACEMKVVMDAYLSKRCGRGPKNLSEAIEYNKQHADLGMPPGQGGQEVLERSDASGGTETSEYRSKVLDFANYAKIYSPQAALDLTGADIVASVSQTCIHRFGSFQRMPSATVPIGILDGIPIGMTLHAKKGNEGMLLQVMAAWEAIVEREAEVALGGGKDQ